MASCTGRGDGGDHCCYIGGQVCQFLNTDGPIPRCGMWDKMNTLQWKRSPVGQWFATNYPGFTCRDWPQKIPDAMATQSGLCCWSGS